MHHPEDLLAEDLLERARLRAPRPGFELEELTRRRERRVLRGRIEAAVVGLALAAAATFGAFTALRPHDGAPAGPGTGDATGAGSTSVNLPPALKAPLVAGAGEYYYQRVHEYVDCSAVSDPAGCQANGYEFEAEAWWAVDDSGRVAVITAAVNHGASEGTYGPGEFPSEGDTRGFPTDTAELEGFLAQRSEDGGASPRPFGTPYPGGPVRDGQVWMAIVDYLGSSQYWNTTPTLRAALLDVLAGLSISSVREGQTDPLGRPAIVIELTAYDAVNRVYVDPDTHDLLALSIRYQDGPVLYRVVEAAGVATSTDERPAGGELSIPEADSPPAHKGEDR